MTTTTTPSPAPTPANIQQTVEAAIKEISHIATLPEVTMKIIKLVEDPESTAQDLNQVISSDPALGARILKVVNSAFYGLPGQIGSINRAVVLLGLNAVKNIAIAASLSKLFRGGKIAANFDARDLWQHAIACATATKLLAEKSGLGLPDEAFLAGLIHDIGIMVEIQARRTDFVAALEKAENDNQPLRAAEFACLGATHEQFGAGLCRMWKFPVAFQFVTGFHHHPMDASEKQRPLVCLVYLADYVVAKLGLGFAHEVNASVPPSAEVLAVVGLDVAAIDAICVAMPKAVEEAQGVFNAAS